MASNQDKSSANPFGGRFQSFGASLRQSAQEISAKAAAQVNELNKKMEEAAKEVPSTGIGGPGTPTANGEVASATPTTAAASSPAISQQQQPATPPTPQIQFPTDHEHVEKKDLVELLQKMNKKVKALTVIRQQLTAKVEAEHQEKMRLQTLVVDEILNGGVTLQPEEDVTAQLQAAWRQHDEQHNLMLQQLQKEFQNAQQQKSNGSGDVSNSKEQQQWETEKKALLARQEQLAAQVETQRQEKVRLQSLVVDEILNGNVALKPEADVTEQLQTAWRQQDEQHNLMLQQLQKEFQQAQQQQSNGDGVIDINKEKQLWEAEKNELLALHRAEIVKLREEIQQESQKVTDSTDNIDPKAEVQRIKEAAAAQLQAFKEKVTAARSAELQKVKTETAAAAKKIMEAKLNEQKEKFQQQLMKIKEVQRSADNSDEVTALQQKLETVQQEHLAQMEQLRQKASAEAESARLKGEEAVESKLEFLRQQHEATLQTMAAKASESEGFLQKQLDETRSALQATVDSLEAQLGHALAQQQARSSELLKDKESALAELRQELELAHSKERKTMEDDFAKQKDAIRADFQSKWKEAMAKSQENFVAQQKEADKKFTAEFNAKLEAIKAEMEAKKEAEIRQARQEGEEAAAQRAEALVAEQVNAKTIGFQAELHSLQQQLHEQNRLLQSAQSREKSLAVELDEVKSVLASTRQGQESSSSQAIDDALAKQRTSYEAMLESERQHMNESFQKQVQKLEQARDDALSQAQQVRDELQATSEKASVQLQVLTLKLAEAEKKQNEQIGALTAAHDAATEVVSTKLSESEERLAKASLESHEALTRLQKEHAELVAKFETVQNDSNDVLSKAQDEVRVLLARNQSLENALRDQSSRVEELQKSVEELNLSHEREISSLRRSLQSGSHADAVEEMEKLRHMMMAENEAELTCVRKSFEEKLREAETKVESVASEQVDASKRIQQLEDVQQKLHDSDDARHRAESMMAELREKLRVAEEKLANAELLLEEAQTQFEARLKNLKEQNAREVDRLQAEHSEVLKRAVEESAADAETAATLARLKDENLNLEKQLETLKQSHEMDRENMRKSMEAHVDKMTLQFKEKVEALKNKASEEVAALQKINQEKDGKLTQLVERLKALTATTTKLRDDNEAMKLKVESETAAQKHLRSQIDAMQKQMDETVANNSATASSLLQRQESLEKDKATLEAHVKRLQGALLGKTNQVEELNGKLQALSSNLNSLTEDQKLQNEKLEQASKQEAALKSREAEVDDLREQINNLKLERTKHVTLVERLQAEKDANERNHGQRTALVGMLETQLAELNDKNSDINAKLEASLYDLSQKDEIIQNYEDRITKLENDLEEAKSIAKKTQEALLAAQKGADSKSSKMVETLQKDILAVKQQMARKSAAAQKLLQQRESECAELRKTNKALQNEVDKGSYSDRRIFELAELQSNRESMQVSEIEARDKIIARLKEALVERDSDLANAEKQVHEVESQMEELFRIRRREDVNIDYLKSIVVQYLSLPPGSTERAGLLPVLATLLQFDEKDYKTIEDGKNRVSWWGSSVVPKMIAAPATSSLPSTVGPASSVSAEVSVSSIARASSGKGTSLQF